MTDVSTYIHIADAIERAAIEWWTKPNGCYGCDRDDCSNTHKQYPSMCRAYVEFIAVAVREAMRGEIAAAVQAERDACAQAAEGERFVSYSFYHGGRYDAAKAIRARSNADA